MLGYSWPSVRASKGDHLLGVVLDHPAWWCWWLDVSNRWCWWLGIRQNGVAQWEISLLYSEWWYTQFNIYDLFISRIFHLIFSDCSWLQATEATWRETGCICMGSDRWSSSKWEMFFFCYSVTKLSLIFVKAVIGDQKFLDTDSCNKIELFL